MSAANGRFRANQVAALARMEVDTKSDRQKAGQQLLLCGLGGRCRHGVQGAPAVPNDVALLRHGQSCDGVPLLGTLASGSDGAVSTECYARSA